MEGQKGTRVGGHKDCLEKGQKRRWVKGRTDKGRQKGKRTEDENGKRIRITLERPITLGFKTNVI